MSEENQTEVLPLKYVYGYDGVTGEYYGIEIAHPCPVTNATYNYPANTTDTAPPMVDEGDVAVFRDGVWDVIKDNRGRVYYDVETRNPMGMFNYLTDELPDNCVWEEDLPEIIPPSPEELRRAEILPELQAIDMASIRPLRADPKTQDDIDRLAELELRAGALRLELAGLIT